MVKTTRDHVRHYRAKQAIHENRDRLLKRGEQKIDWRGMLADKRDRALIFAYGTALALMSMVAYVTMIVLWFKVYYQSFNTTVIWFFMLMFISMFMVIGSRGEILGRDRPWLRFLGGFFLLSTIVGSVVGFLLYFKSLAYYWKYESLRTYTNVGASQRAEGFADAGMLLLTEDSRLDPMRSVGFKSRWTGQTYCAAPIVDGRMAMTDPIYFWAVGENCCGSRSSFSCGDASNPTTRSALVLLEPEEVVRPFMTWAVRGAVYPRYERSVMLQQATYNTVAPEKIKLVQWVKDPIAAKDAFYTDARTRCIWVSLIYFFLLELFTCYVVARYMVAPKQLENVVRQVAGPLATRATPEAKAAAASSLDAAI
eukprot:TRINITY_DN3238_c0_g1_i3.p1 TRINITY_DN3238_c0_g1~~TRINITY_DN3238_c0_g1_i3.p1  ORF type:complete len:367 (-),score=82.19 TRINITY_DN3238_c0_g1_i3:39-1139(-)